MQTKTILVAPDGGWGWVIIFACALNNIIVIPIMQVFALLFKDKFRDIGMTATDSTIIINVNSAFGMALGLINGPLLRKFGYRKVALLGGFFIVVGVFSTAWASEFMHFIVTYSLITSVGMAVVTASFSLALNTYFKKRRNKAMGLAMTLTGLGPVFMPQIISICVGYYGVQGTVLILAALSLHSVLAALLLQPVKWHLKTEEVELTEEEAQLLAKEQAERKETDVRKPRVYNEEPLDHEVDRASLYGFDTPVTSRRNSLVSNGKGAQGAFRRQFSKPNSRRGSTYGQNKFWSSTASITSSAFGSSAKIVEENPETTSVSRPGQSERQTEEQNALLGALAELNPKIVITTETAQEDTDAKEIKKRSYFRNLLSRIAIFFDFDLLTDPSYVNLMLGMSIAIFAEINFSLLTPFFLDDFHFTTKQTASVMSLIGSVDIVFRFLSPYIGDSLNISPKVMYMFSMVLLIAGRSCMVFYNSYSEMLAIAVFLGVGKGFRTVYMSLVIPAYVPLERLASASGIQMVTNGLILMAFGPLLGVIRDQTGSYSDCIIFINAVTLLTIIMWSLEFIIVYYRRRKAKKDGLTSEIS